MAAMYIVLINLICVILNWNVELNYGIDIPVGNLFFEEVTLTHCLQDRWWLQNLMSVPVDDT